MNFDISKERAMELAMLEEGFDVGAGPIRKMAVGYHVKLLNEPFEGLTGRVIQIIGTGEFVRVKLTDSKIVEVAQRHLERVGAPSKKVKKAPPAQCAR